MCPIPKPPPSQPPYELILYDNQGINKSYKDLDPDIGDDAAGSTVYTKAEAKKGVWVVYEGKLYNKDNENGKFVIVEEKTKVDLDFRPSSVRRLVAEKANSVTVFEHKNFGGYQFFTQQRAINTLDDKELTPFSKSGVSSIYIPPPGGKWRFFIGGPYLTEPGITFSAGRYLNMREYGVDDKIWSFTITKWTL